MIRLSNIRKSYRSAAGKESVLEGLDFQLDKGEYVGFGDGEKYTDEYPRDAGAAR